MKEEEQLTKVHMEKTADNRRPSSSSSSSSRSRRRRSSSSSSRSTSFAVRHDV